VQGGNPGSPGPREGLAAYGPDLFNGLLIMLPVACCVGVGQVSTDGPFNNVLKIKPPLCFSREDALVLVAALDKALADLSAL
jgi:hypothetical protein